MAAGTGASSSSEVLPSRRLLTKQELTLDPCLISPVANTIATSPAHQSVVVWCT